MNTPAAATAPDGTSTHRLGDEVRRAGRAMGTTTLLVVHHEDAHLLDEAEAHIADLERRWSRFLADSEISVLNRAAGAPVIVRPDTFSLIMAAVDGARATDGRFDPTVHDAVVALGYDRSFDEISGQDERSAGGSVPQPAPGAEGIDLDEALLAVRLPVGVRLDLGGIGKGTAADLVSGWAMGRGARGIAVSIGGDVRVRGTAPAGGGWAFTHGIDDLDLPTLGDGGVCTSSTARRRWSTPTGPVHHLVDPNTGRCTGDGIESITVVAGTAQQAEVLTKAAMVAGDDAEGFLSSFGVAHAIRRRGAW